MSERVGDPGGRGGSRTKLWLVLALGLAFHVPSLWMGFYADDYVHQIALHEPERLPHALETWNLFDFGSYADWAPLYERYGGMPWWISPSWKVRFFRPLASASMWLDAEVYGRWAIGCHLTSLCFYGLLLVALHALYRDLGLAPRTALVGLSFFALGDSTMLPVGWLANRNALLAALFTVLAMLAIARRERLGERRAIALGLAAAALATLSKESGVVAFALVALLLVIQGGETREPRSRRRSIGAASLALALAFAHLIALAAFGFGTRSLFYATPWSEPGRFVEGIARLSTLGILSLAGPLPLDALWMTGANLDLLALAAALPALGLVVWISRRVGANASSLPLAALLFFGLVPEGSAPLSDRLLFGASMGSAGLFALLYERLRGEGIAASERFGGRLLFLSLTLGSGSLLAMQTLTFSGVTREIRDISLRADVGPPELGWRDVLVLQAPSALGAFALPSTWAAESADRELAFWPVQIGRRGLRWTRVDDRTLEFETLDEPFLEGLFEIVYLAEPVALEPGRRWRTPLFEIEATKVEQGHLRAIRLTLDVSAADEHLRYLVSHAGSYVHQPPPAIGETLVIESAPPMRPLLP